MNLVNSILAETEPLPPLDALGYQYVIAGNGLFIRAEDSRLAALIPIADDLMLHGLVALEPRVEFKLPHIPEAFLHAILASARRHLPNEAMYQLRYENGAWRITMPQAKATVTSLQFDDDANAVLDIHSHGALGAFFSSTDDGDETGFRVYIVIGNVDTERPTIAARVGVYGHHYNILPTIIFESMGPFVWGPYLQDDNTDADASGLYETESGLLVARY